MLKMLALALALGNAPSVPPAAPKVKCVNYPVPKGVKDSCPKGTAPVGKVLNPEEEGKVCSILWECKPVKT